LERETGFEPATLSLGNGPTGSAGVRSGSQGLVSTGAGAHEGVQRSQGERPVVGDFATPLLPEDGFLTVREVARHLRLSTATVYELCASKRLENVRILNVIRVSRLGLRSFVEGGSENPSDKATTPPAEAHHPDRPD
jgi:excisionase family DNA binding protein